MATHEVQPDEAGAQPVEAPAPKLRRALALVKRELSDEELDSSGAKKLLLDYLERAEEENNELKSFRNLYHKVDKELGILQEKFRTNTALEVLSTGTITIGAAALVYSQNFGRISPQDGSQLCLASS